jgi:hypothetical protein
MGIDERFTTEYVTFRLSNVPVRWAHLFRPDTEFGNNRWSMEILSSDEMAKELTAMGYNLKTKTDKEGNVTKNILFAKKNVLDRNGKPQRPPMVVGPDGVTPWTEELGNGTIVNVVLQARAWKVNHKWTLGCYIDKVQVVTHVPRGTTFADLTKEDVPF